MTDVFKIAEILVSHAREAGGDSVGIIAYCGSYAKGTATPKSDLDIYYVPDKGKEGLLDATFILGGLPYDFWGPPWAMLEEIANARSVRPWAVSASLVADARVIHQRSEDDRVRFAALQERIRELTQPESLVYMVGRALAEYPMALARLGQMRLALRHDDFRGLHWAGWQFVARAVNCLALANQVYFSKGWGANTDQILRMAQKPPDLERMLFSILQPGSAAGALAWAERLAEGVRLILRQAQESLAGPVPSKEVLSDFYYYFREYSEKIRSACDGGDVLAASSAAFHMQELVSGLLNLAEAGFYDEAFNLLGEYAAGYRMAGFPDLLEPASKGELTLLSERVSQLEVAAKKWFNARLIPLNILDDESDLRRFLEARRPALQ